MLKLYGSFRSRASRTLWMLAECGVPYEQEDFSKLEGEAKTATLTRVNPLGKVPAIEDGDLRLFESMAINLYLAKKFGKGLQPKTVEDEGRTLMWSFWAMTEVEALARALKVVGLMNAQFAVKDGVPYILEVNPRASRTVPSIAPRWTCDAAGTARPISSAAWTSGASRPARSAAWIMAMPNAPVARATIRTATSGSESPSKSPLW